MSEAILNKRNIFLLDGVGAIVSAISAGVVLPFFADITGIPQSVSYLIGLIAILFASYSLSRYYFVKQIKPRMLLLIIFANLMYGVFAGVVGLTFDSLTAIGRAYFVLDVVVILVVVSIEARVYRRM